MRRASYAVAALALLSGCVVATPATAPVTAASKDSTSSGGNVALIRGAVIGQKQLIGHFIQLTPSCESVGLPTVRIAVPPQNGRLSIEEGQDFPTYPKDNPRFLCDSKKAPALLLYYTSNPGYLGADSTKLDLVFKTEHYTVTSSRLA
jgi:hypothetical protein